MSVRNRIPTLALFVALALFFTSSPARADRRYFVQSYTPYTAPLGDLELEMSSFAASGQGDPAAVAWLNRFELEYGITDRLSGAAYLNFIQGSEPEAPTRFDGPSLEFIYRLAEPGRLPLTPAAYLEVRANGDEIELEPKLLLARRDYRLVSVVNVIGEYERVHLGPDRGETEKRMQVTAGLSREVGRAFAFGLEAVYTRDFIDRGVDPTSIQVGPTINLQSPKIQLALGWQPQISGSPATRGSRNLLDFPRSEVRLILGVTL